MYRLAQAGSLLAYSGMSETTPPEWWSALAFPPCIDTKRLTLRAFGPGDAIALKDAIDANLDHLQAWMPWAMSEPSPLDAIESRMERFATAFANGPEWGYAIRLTGQNEIIGGCGLHASVGDDALEIGYWIDSRHLRRGYATEAAAALTATAFALPSITRVEIRCDPANVASAAVPRRLGFMYIQTLDRNTRTPRGDLRDTMVFEQTRERFVQRDSS
jgi:RimJ/RimL family protein N-acetyltransferase